MKASDNIFRFIKSLNQTEKAYFKIYASKHFRGKENISVKLFEAIDKQKKYDEDKIIRQLANLLPASRLSKEKNYLYHLILKILRNYHANQSIDIQLKCHLQDIEILYKKALYSQCFKTLKKAKKIAYKHEKHLDILEIIKWEEKLYFSGKAVKNLEKPVLEEGEILNKIENTHEYDHLLSMVLKLTKGEGLLRDQDKINILSTIISHPLLDNEEKTNSYEAKSRYYHIYSLYFQATGELSQSYEICKKWMQLHETHPELIDDDPLRYIAALNNFLLSMDKMKQQDEFEFTLKKLATIHQKYPNVDTESIKIIVFMRYYSHLLAFYNHTGNFEKTITQIPEIETGLLEYKGKLDKKHKLTLFLYIANAYCSLDEFSKALVWLNEILNDTDIETRQDIHGFAKILELLIHHEHNEVVLLESRVKSTYRFLATKHRLFQFESAILDFFRNELFKTISQKELIEAFKKLRKKLIKHLKKDPFERKALEYFDFISWLESKIEDRPMREIIKEKLRLKDTAVKSLEPVH